MVDWPFDSTRRDQLSAQLSGTAGISTFPAGASPANGVSIAEVQRAIWGQIAGTATGENGITTFPAAAAPADTVSLAEVLREIFDQAEKAVSVAAAVLSTGVTKFTIAGGPILITQLISICQVGSDSTAATLQWSADGTQGSAATFTGASASRANQAAGDMIICNFTALTTAPDLVANGVGLGPVIARTGIIVPAGIITTTVGSGPTTTGTYTHHLRYRPLSRGVTVV